MPGEWLNVGRHRRYLVPTRARRCSSGACGRKIAGSSRQRPRSKQRAEWVRSRGKRSEVRDEAERPARQLTSASFEHLRTPSSRVQQPIAIVHVVLDTEPTPDHLGYFRTASRVCWVARDIATLNGHHAGLVFASDISLARRTEAAQPTKARAPPRRKWPSLTTDGNPPGNRVTGGCALRSRKPSLSGVKFCHQV